MDRQLDVLGQLDALRHAVEPVDRVDILRTLEELRDEVPFSQGLSPGGLPMVSVKYF